MNVVIIEESFANRDGLSNTFQNLNPPVNIIAVLNSVKQGVEFFKKPVQYDLIFSDVKVSEGLCSDILRSVRIHKPIIFCDAYTSFTDVKAPNKLNFFRQINTFPNPVSDRDKNGAIENKSVLVYHKDRIVPVAINSIAIFFIDNEVVKLLCFNGIKYSLSGKLDEYEALYFPKFFRANRQFLISYKAVKEVSKFFSRKLIVQLNIPFNQQIIISKTKATGFLSWLSGT